MRAVNPYPIVPGDSPDRVMARSGSLVGFGKERSVWRFGFMEDSDSAQAFDIHIEAEGFLWVLATRKTGKIVEEWIGYALDLPHNFQRILEWEPK